MSTRSIAEGIVARHVPAATRLDREALTAAIREAILDVANRELARVSKLELPPGRELAIVSEIASFTIQMEKRILEVEYPEAVRELQALRRRLLQSGQERKPPASETLNARQKNASPHGR